MEEEKDVKKIVIHYEDGTEKVIDKGFFCNMKEEDGSAVLEFTMCHVSDHGGCPRYLVRREQ